MTKEKIEEVKHLLFHEYSWTSIEIDKFDLHIDDIIEATEQVICNTRCCCKLKDKEAVSFDEWLKTENIEIDSNNIWINGVALGDNETLLQVYEEMKPNL